MARYDVIVIGGGHNGLTCAAYLAKAGRKVALVEGRDVVGGLAVGPALHDTRVAGPLSNAAGFRASIVDHLALRSHGLEVASAPLRTAVVGSAGRVVLSRDVAATSQSIAQLSAEDGQRYREFRQFIDAIRPVVSSFIDRPPLDLVNVDSQPKLELVKRALGLRRLGRERMLELFRVAPMSAADWLSEWFESGLVRAGMALPALALAYAGPRAPGTAANVLLAECGESVNVGGGGSAVTAALASACKAAGVEISTGKKATRLVVRDGSAVGVAIDGGETLEAGAVVCACDPRTALLELAPPGALPSITEWRVGNWRARGTIAHLAVEVEGEVDLEGADRLVVVDDIDDLERAFDAVKYGQCAKRPALEVDVGKGAKGASLSIRIHHVAHDCAGDDGLRKGLESAALERLQVALPGIRERISETSLWLPADIAAELGSSGGHLGHGELTLDQLLVRPSPECSQYRTPIKSLFLASAGCHGGGEMTGLPGAFAARAVLRS